MCVNSTLPCSEPQLDRRAFRRMYRDHYAFVWHTVLRFGVPSLVAEDAVQDAFIAAYRRRSDFDGVNPRAWLYAIGRRTAANYRRGIRRRHRGHDAAAVATSGKPRPVDEIASALRVLGHFLDGLSAADRELFVLSEVDGLTGPELSAALGRNLATLYSRVRTLRVRFADHVDDASDAIERARQGRPRAKASAWLALVPHLRSPVAGIAKSVGSAWLTTQLKGLATGLVLGGVVLVTVGAATRTDERPRIAAVYPDKVEIAAVPSGVAPPSVSSSPVFAAVAPTPIAEPPRPPRRTEPAVRGGKRKARGQTTRAARPDLAADTALLQRAAAAMRRGESGSALTLLAEHDRVHTQSPMSDLRSALVVEALCAVGRVDEARGEAKSALAEHASTPAAKRIRRSCAGPT